MMIIKLGVLACGFYLVLTSLMELGLLIVVRIRGQLGVFYAGKHPELVPGLFLGAIFAAIWLISFILAWHVTYVGLRHVPTKF